MRSAAQQSPAGPTAEIPGEEQAPSVESDSHEAQAPAGPGGAELNERDARILDFERSWWKYSGAKEQAIREQFNLSATHYYQALNRLIDTQEALAHDPMLVKRLRRLRTSRQRARTARRLGSRA